MILFLLLLPIILTEEVCIVDLFKSLPVNRFLLHGSDKVLVYLCHSYSPFNIIDLAPELQITKTFEL